MMIMGRILVLVDDLQHQCGATRGKVGNGKMLVCCSKIPALWYSWQSDMTSTKRLQGIVVLKIIDHLTMAFFTAGKINLDSGRRLHLWAIKQICCPEYVIRFACSPKSGLSSRWNLKTLISQGLFFTRSKILTNPKTFRLPSTSSTCSLSFLISLVFF